MSSTMEIYMMPWDLGYVGSQERAFRGSGIWIDTWKWQNNNWVWALVWENRLL